MLIFKHNKKNIHKMLLRSLFMVFFKLTLDICILFDLLAYKLL
nr:MAG TPA: hypothetical protein [Caudoviricetes sp.]